MSPVLKVTCTACGSKNVVLGSLKYLNRSFAVTCNLCGHVLTSRLKFRTYLALIVYVQIIVVLTGAPFVLALAGGFWLFAAAAAFMFFLLTMPPAMALHIHSLRHHTRSQDAPPRNDLI